MIFDPHHGYHIISNVGEIQEEKTKLVAGALTKKYHWIFYALLYPITFLIDYYIVSKKINQLVDRYNPTNAFVDNTFVALHFSRLRKKSKIKNLGLRGMGALLLGFRISKKEQISNWGKGELTRSQIAYAATDAWVGREIYLHMEHRGLVPEPFK